MVMERHDVSRYDNDLASRNYSSNPPKLAELSNARGLGDARLPKVYSSEQFETRNTMISPIPQCKMHNPQCLCRPHFPPQSATTHHKTRCCRSESSFAQSLLMMIYSSAATLLHGVLISGSSACIQAVHSLAHGYVDAFSKTCK
jgi:hypothetical protein